VVKARAISRVDVELKTNVSEISVSIIRTDGHHYDEASTTSTLKMETGKVCETLVFNSTLTRLIAREDISTSLQGYTHTSLVKF
jgi:hypothetical protein